MRGMSQPKLDYETPRPPSRGPMGCAPYIVFGVFAAAAGFGFSLRGPDHDFGMLFGVPCALGAIVLPLVIAIQEK